jgi:hypothetical protein
VTTIECCTYGGGFFLGGETNCGNDVVDVLTEDFEGGTPPAGWTVVDNAGTGVAWNTAAYWGEGNYCGTGEAATVSSDAFGTANYDTWLITPNIDLSGALGAVLDLEANFQNFATPTSSTSTSATTAVAAGPTCSPGTRTTEPSAVPRASTSR